MTGSANQCNLPADCKRYDDGGSQHCDGRENCPQRGAANASKVLGFDRQSVRQGAHLIQFAVKEGHVSGK